MTLTPVTGPDFPVLRELADTIWRQHYAAIISVAQIDYMLAGRFSDEALHGYQRATNRWLELLRVSGIPVGYCDYQRTQEHDDDPVPNTMKVGQLYVLESHRGMGLGSFMLRSVEGRAREFGLGLLWLQVNKRNSGAIGFYRAMGFAVAREAVFDIGGGFVMDDYIMEKRLG